MTRPGGFRTRFVPAWARLLWTTVRWHFSRRAFEETMAGAWASQQRRDRQRACPHPPGRQSSPIEGYVDCDECGMTLKNPARFNVDPAVVVEPADGFSWERRHARPGWEGRYADKGLPTP